MRRQSISRGRLKPGVEQEGRRAAGHNISGVEGAPSSTIAQTPPIESAAKKNASVEETPIGGTPREPASPGNLRKPGLREAAVRAALGSEHTGEREFLYLSVLWRK